MLYASLSIDHVVVCEVTVLSAAQQTSPRSYNSLPAMRPDCFNGHTMLPLMFIC